MERHKSPLRYPGGKAVLAPYLTKLIERNQLSDGIYAEPFAGGAGAALELLFNECVWKILINDADYHIYAFWKAAVELTEQFCEQIDTIPVSVEEWRRQFGIFQNATNVSLLEAGFATFYLNRTNRSGILDGKPIGGFDQTGKWKIDARYNKEGLKKRITQLGRYRDRIGIYNLEAREFLANVVQPLQEKVLVYLDPPYYKMGAYLYLNFYNHDDHAALASHIKNELFHPWVLSYDDVPQIREMYGEMASIYHSLDYHANEYKSGKEVLFFSRSIKNIPSMN